MGRKARERFFTFIKKGKEGKGDKRESEGDGRGREREEVKAPQFTFWAMPLNALSKKTASVIIHQRLLSITD